MCHNSFLTSNLDTAIQMFTKLDVYNSNYYLWCTLKRWYYIMIYDLLTDNNIRET